MDRELLSQYSAGLIATTGCPSGEVQTRLRLGQYDEAVKAASEYRDLFGRENYFAEIMDHGLGIEKRIMDDLLRLAKQLDLPLVATNDLHYTHAHDAKSHAALLCVQSGSTLDDPNRFKFDADEFYLKTAAEMRHLFRDHPEACDNTLLIAERANVQFNTSAKLHAALPVPEGESEESWFVQGGRARPPRALPRTASPTTSRAQADYEVGVISQMGFPGYFLVVADFINWSKSNGASASARAADPGAGSMAAYAMRITDLDPLRHGLIFERFLNPDRVSMPDFDVDLRRAPAREVIRYVTEKYGDERVAADRHRTAPIKAKQA
jgi:DNA polymerase-3 subunit alpha